MPDGRETLAGYSGTDFPEFNREKDRVYSIIGTGLFLN